MAAPAQRRHDPRPIRIACRGQVQDTGPRVLSDRRAPPAPDRRFIVRPHLSSAQSVIRSAYRRHGRPSPLALLAAGATIVGVVGVSTGASAATSASGPVPAPGMLARAAATPAPELTGAATARADAGSPLAPASAAAAAAQPAASKSPAVSPAVSPTARTAATATPTAAGQVTTQQDASAAPAATQPAPRKQYPYEIYDSVTPDAIPGSHVVATYATGPFAVPGAEVAGDKAVVWIDTTGTDPHAAALDIEPGDVTPSQAASWVAARLAYDPTGTAILYTMISEWPQVQASVSTLPQWMQSHVRWWIADPTGYPHMVPGANATQWYWGANYDISTANPGF